MHSGDARLGAVSDSSDLGGAKMMSDSGSTERKHVACSECNRLRVKCVFEMRADGSESDSCGRCIKLGKVCEQRKAGARGRRRAKLARSKPTSCCECYRVRVKCNYMAPKPGMPSTCERCHSTGRKCFPRVVVRGRPSAANFRAELARLGLDVYDMSLAAPKTNPSGDKSAHDVEVNKTGAAGLASLLQTLNLKQVPPLAKVMPAHLLLLGKEQRSMKRIHGAVSMAATLGLDSIMDLLTTELPPLSAEQVQTYSRYAEQHYLVPAAQGPSLITRSNVGRREVLPNSAWEYFVSPVHKILELINQGAHGIVDSWSDMVEEKDKVRALLGRFPTAILTEGGSIGPDGLLGCVLKSDGPLTFVDPTGARFRAEVDIMVSISENAHFHANGVALRDFRPIDAAAEARWRGFLEQLSANSAAADMVPLHDDASDSAAAIDARFYPEMLFDESDSSLSGSENLMDPDFSDV